MGFLRKRKQVPEAERRYGGMVLRKHADDAKNFTGLEILDPQPFYSVPVTKVMEGLQEGWVTFPDGSSVVHKPGGNKLDPWKVTHTFTHAPTICFHTIHGPANFKVVRQPDKYVPGDPTDVMEQVERPDAEVKWDYLVERVNG